MITSRAGGLRVALLLNPSGYSADNAGAVVDEIANELTAQGHRPSIVAASPIDLAERLLQSRGFAGPLTQIPSVVADLRQGRYDIVEAFTPVDAVAGLLSRRLGGPPVVFTPSHAPSREVLGERRLSLSLASQAYKQSDAVLALDEEIQAAISRWLALNVEIVKATDGAARGAVFERSLARLRREW